MSKRRALERSSSPIARVFEQCRADGRAALIAFFTAGYPTLESTASLIEAAGDGGADIIELGFPYSDPLADGPAIQASSQRALENGATLDRIFETVTKLNAPVPLLAFSYYNPLYVRGLERTAADLAAAGFAGAIVPDLPPEEAQPLMRAFEETGLSLNFLVAPTTPAQRAKNIAALCSDFVYVASRLGVTGTHAGANSELRSRIEQLRAVTDKPLAVGFGISQPAHAASIAADADAVVVGSALIEACSGAAPAEAVQRLCAAFRDALRSSAAAGPVRR